MFPVGMYYCFTKLTDANIFIIMYGATSIYFAVSGVVSPSVMVCCVGRHGASDAGAGTSHVHIVWDCCVWYSINLYAGKNVAGPDAVKL